jgi:hypothetical protein
MKSKKSKKHLATGHRSRDNGCGWNTNKRDKRRKTRQADVSKHLKEFGND